MIFIIFTDFAWSSMQRGGVGSMVLGKFCGVDLYIWQYDY